MDMIAKLAEHGCHFPTRNRNIHCGLSLLVRSVVMHGVAVFRVLGMVVIGSTSGSSKKRMRLMLHSPLFCAAVVVATSCG